MVIETASAVARRVRRRNTEGHDRADRPDGRRGGGSGISWGRAGRGRPAPEGWIPAASR